MVHLSTLICNKGVNKSNQGRPNYSAIYFFTVLIRMAIITVTVIPAVILLAIYAINAVTVISENILSGLAFLSVFLPRANSVTQ